MTINASRNFVRPGREMSEGGGPVTGSGAIQNQLTSIFTTRGSIDLNEARLPNLNDVNVRPSDPLIAYDAFIVSAAGTPPAGVTGNTTLAVGDYLILTNNGSATTATNWMGLTNSALALPNSGYTLAGAKANWVRVIDVRLPFFP